MFGLVIAIILFFTTSGGAETSFLKSTKFLFFWHVMWTIFMFVPLVLGTIFGATVIDWIARLTHDHIMSKLFSFLGYVGGSIVVISMALTILVVQACCLIGSYLLKNAGKEGYSFHEFDQKKILIGSALILADAAMGLSTLF